MRWLKSVLIDLGVTVVIVVYVLEGPTWSYWVLIIYTPLMLLLKIAALTSGVAPGGKKSADTPPVWFFHVLYGINLILLLIAEQFLLAVGWAIIWILSAVLEARNKPGKSS
jgi:hypothetical protein